ncbi:hypothetical protein, partial [Klebsiella grimontii]|uniref:hypothetical protein n=1 Tax=Klebsiella grimontii TaxID=2058152 RepID=UPI0039F04868
YYNITIINDDLQLLFGAGQSQAPKHGELCSARRCGVLLQPSTDLHRKCQDENGRVFALYP